MTIVYTKPHCPKCMLTQRLLTEAGVPFIHKDGTDDAHIAQFRQDGFQSFPVVYPDDAEPWCDFRPDKIQLVSTKRTINNQ